MYIGIEIGEGRGRLTVFCLNDPLTRLSGGLSYACARPGQRHRLARWRKAAFTLITPGLVGPVSSVEMECSALFSAGAALGLPSVALLVVSRSRERLINPNTPDALARHLPKRNQPAIHANEAKCFELALEIAQA